VGGVSQLNQVVNFGTEDSNVKIMQMQFVSAVALPACIFGRDSPFLGIQPAIEEFAVFGYMSAMDVLSDVRAAALAWV
jgi:hypothetical protein